MSTKETEILDFRFLGGFYILPWSQVVRQAGLFNLNRTDNTAVCETVRLRFSVEATAASRQCGAVTTRCA